MPSFTESRTRSSTSQRRWGRKSSSNIRKQQQQLQLEEEDYSDAESVEDNIFLDDGPASSAVDSQLSPASTAGPDADDYFVTSPRKRAGLTGSISTLFRRVVSRESPRATGQSAFGSDADTNHNDHDNETDQEGVERRGSGQASPPARDDLFASDVPSQTSQEDEDVSTVGPRVSILPMSQGGPRSRSERTDTSRSTRIFASYSDDDSEDESFRRQRSLVSQGLGSPTTTRDSEWQSESMDENDPRRKLRRYRGFSTSIASLFLDESLVCTSIGCFGLILSNRTEYLLQVRDHIRGVKQTKKNQAADKRSPSKVFSYLLLLTIVLIFFTFVIWGFGNGNALAEDLSSSGQSGEDAAQTDDEANANQYQYQQEDDYYRIDDDNSNAANNQYNDDAIANNNNDDNANNNNDDGGQGNDDGNGGAGNNDNDDGAGNDDAGNDANNNNDDNYANDDNAQNDDAAAANDDGDDYYAAGDDGNNRRKLERSILHGADTTRSHHRATGVFKLRECQENIWNPIAAFAQDQWDREAHAQRSLADAYTDDFDSYDYDAQESDAPQRDLAADIRTALFLTFLLFLGVLGRRRRMRTRFQLVRARAQDDRLYHIAQSGRSRHISMKDELEDKAYEVACSHTILGCYPIDPPEDEEIGDEELEVNDQGVTTSRKKAQKHEDFVSRGFACLMSACCGCLCSCWFQCLSVCALAQEAREMRLLLPPRYQRIDFITHQPFSEYQKDVNELRRGWMGTKRKKSGFVTHFNALSRLSRYILFTAGTTIFIIVATLLFNPRAGFSWPDAVLLMATFAQSFLVLFIVHWIFHKSDLSLDAVIKFFAAGFVIAVPSAVFFEGILVNLILMMAWTVYEIFHALIGEAFASWMAANYRIIWVLGELFNAYIVAAVIEELCKYYTFRSVEHPDLIFLTGLDRKSHDEHAADGGLAAYPFGSHKVSDALARTKSFEKQKSNEEKLKKMLPSNNTTEEFYEDENDVRTYRQKAAAVTTGMIGVAVGLACAENMMYVFLLGGARGSANAEHQGDIYEEWIVLLFRSVFPIHALSAALQSVNMIRKFVEGSNHNNHRIGVGRIIFPAVVLHGTFDAILMGINVYVESAWDEYLEENGGRVGEGEPYNPTTVNFVAWCSICMVTLIGFLWYIRENRNQQAMLILLEEQDKGESYVSPAGITPKRDSKRSRQRK